MSAMAETTKNRFPGNRGVILWIEWIFSIDYRFSIFYRF